ncbi:MAG: hypothetical protein HN390_02810 [Anaerolineae bacterium]|jgi:hypothetical protein|nr:hypothetical protein [Anaerolineae bacterium]MBT7190733.1 hypothetical protein [Anaerolineae bacterium]MBT7989721.1 hypothetical protein [Anaerolineae bacterium]
MHFSPIIYLDPGSGSIIIQLLVAALLGAGFFIRSQWAKIKKMLGMDSTDETSEDVDDFEE